MLPIRLVHMSFENLAGLFGKGDTLFFAAAKCRKAIVNIDNRFFKHPFSPFLQPTDVGWFSFIFYGLHLVKTIMSFDEIYV